MDPHNAPNVVPERYLAPRAEQLLTLTLDVLFCYVKAVVSSGGFVLIGIEPPWLSQNA